MREQRNLTQASLAEKLSINRSTVTKWETGAAKPRVDMLIRLSQLFNCSVEELLSAPQELTKYEA